MSNDNFYVRIKIFKHLPSWVYLYYNVVFNVNVMKLKQKRDRGRQKLFLKINSQVWLTKTVVFFTFCLCSEEKKRYLLQLSLAIDIYVLVVFKLNINVDHSKNLTVGLKFKNAFWISRGRGRCSNICLCNFSRFIVYSNRT